MAAQALSLERGVMVDWIAGRSASSCPWQMRRRPEIWSPHQLAGFFIWVAGAIGVGAWNISCEGVCLGRGGGGGVTIAWHTSLQVFRVESLTSIGVMLRIIWSYDNFHPRIQSKNGSTFGVLYVWVPQNSIFYIRQISRGSRAILGSSCELSPEPVSELPGDK